MSPNEVRGRGRPSFPEGEARSALIKLRVTPDEKLRLQVAAETRDETVSEFVRRIVLRAADRTRQD